MAGFSYNEFITVLTTPAELNQYLTSIGPIEIDQYDYLGFNFKKIVEKFCENARKNNRAKNEMIADAVNIVAVALSRGNIRRDQLDKTADNGKKKIEELATFYEIPIRANRTTRINLQQGTLSFTRSLSVFPHFASMLLAKEPNRAKEGKKTGLESFKLPAAMKHGGFGALIPTNCTNVVKSVYMASFAAYMIEFGEVINPADAKKSYQERYAFQKSIIVAAQTGGCLSDEIKAYYLGILGLTEPAVFDTLVAVTNLMMTKIGKSGVPDALKRSCIIQNKVLVCPTIEAQNGLEKINNLTTLTVQASGSQSQDVTNNNEFDET